MVYIKLFGPVSVTKGNNMPNWRDELKAEIESVQESVNPPDIITARPFHELCALILELIDHIPEERDAMRLVRKSSIEGDK